MITPNRKQWWPARWFTGLRLLAMLVCLLVAVPAPAARPVAAEPSPPRAQPLGQYLNPDGTLALPAGQAISLDPRGYQLVSGPGEAPRFAPAQPDANPGDENWASGLFSLPGTDAPVYAVAVDGNGHVYVGGTFTTAGGVSANNIAKWNGATWSTLGSGMNGIVRALADDAAGNLYAGGAFTTAGGVSAHNIAKWDGATWSALGNGMNSSVSALVFDAAGHLYAGGSFTTAGGISVNNIATWDGTAWFPLGSGITGGEPYLGVYALAVGADGNLYAGGTFTTAGGVSANNIAKWNGATWSALDSGVSGGDFPYVSTLAFDVARNLYAGGTFTTAGEMSAHNIAKWDGATWSALGSGMNSSVSALVFDAADHLYAGGSFETAGGVSATGVAKWDGATWSALGDGLPGVSTLATDTIGNIYAGGSFTRAVGVGAKFIAKWNGSSWSALGSGMNSSVEVLAVDSAGTLYAGGYFTWADGVNVNGIAKWNGDTWSALGSGMGGCGACNPFVYALAVDTAGHLYAGGRFTTAGGVSANHIAQWDGTVWSALGSGVDGSVYALAVDAAGNLYAGGFFHTAGGVSANSIAKWDGTVWSALGSGTDGPVSALAVDAAGNLYAGGYFTTAGGISANYIATWDGVAWSALGSGMDSSVSALAVDAAGNLYAGGIFTSAGGVSANYIAKWDGSTWSALGSGVSSLNNPPVRALAIDAAGNLYAGGTLTTAGGISANHIALWNGATWSPLGSGMNSLVRTLALDGSGNLYAGGESTTAGNHASAYIGRWTAADGVRGVAAGSYTFYVNNLPVTIDVVTPGTLDRLAVQRFNRSHPQATPSLNTSYYWEIAGTDANGNPASGYVVDVTLPATFMPDAGDQVCRYTGNVWDCAASAFTANSITRAGITQLSDWAVQDNVACADFDGDGTIDIDDLIAIANRWGQTSSTPGWDGRFDLRPDGRIDIADIQLTAAQWGQSCSFQVYRVTMP